MKVARGHIHISRGKSPDPALDDSPVLQSFQKTFCGETASGRDAKSRLFLRLQIDIFSIFFDVPGRETDHL